MAAATGAWHESGCYQVSEGVYRIPLPLPHDSLKAINVYAVIEPDGLVLIDSGWDIPEARTALEEALDSLGFSVADIRTFLVTHVHRDHYTQAIQIRREYGTQIALGVHEKPSLEHLVKPDRKPLDSQIRSLYAHGAPELAARLAEFAGRDAKEEWEMPCQWLNHAETVSLGSRALEVLATPGHTQGHVVFHDIDAALLFSGDHILPSITPSIGFEQVLSPDPLANYMDSLQLILSRTDAVLLPAHGDVWDSAHRRAKELLDHHGERLDQTLRPVLHGAGTATEIAAQLDWTRRKKHLSELDPFNQMLAIAETAAHLSVLATLGQVSASEVDGVTCYSPA
ncbi:MBL fold metallo-hydrolase [Arthrobacter sp. I2-34]|uniref:MBL fold metallo-hydrolase n=1 Tax=Arthrobacter hankyongi TaxID=2904801 RepID=A0ABS9L3Y9_9MICC|nr:MBL fold metallo-hydrolase [Arthrobacter hankyongi]MCG2621335.1 MBL fold metallo-hydrolase [Arthrobacter hankyongi]